MIEVVLKEYAERIFNRLPHDLQQKFLDEFKRLSQEGLAHPNVRKIRSTKIGYRLRVGRWRVFFAFFDKQKLIEVVDIFLKKGRDDYQRRMHLLK